MRRDVFQAIADPGRREIIKLLSHKPLTINSIVHNFEISRPAISKQLKILKECELITFKKQGREHICHLQAKNLLTAFEWLRQYHELWEDKPVSFEDYLLNLQARMLKESENKGKSYGL